MPRPEFDYSRFEKKRKAAAEESETTKWDKLSEEVPFAGAANSTKQAIDDKFDFDFRDLNDSPFPPEPQSPKSPAESPARNNSVESATEKPKTQREILNDKLDRLKQKIISEGGLNHISETTKQEMALLAVEKQRLDQADAIVEQIENMPIATLNGLTESRRATDQADLRRKLMGMARTADSAHREAGRLANAINQTPTQSTPPPPQPQKRGFGLFRKSK